MTKMTKMTKKDIQKMPDYFDKYINLVEDDVSLIEALQVSLQELENAPIDKWEALGEKVYAPNKWTVKDILQHYIDTERVFAYRITAIARGDKQKMTSYDENIFAENAQANRRTITDLLEELILIRKATIKLYLSFTENMLHQQGISYNNIHYCPLALGFVLTEHQRWHFRILEEKYYPLLIE